jgi:ABC-2 type transport system permease protein
MKIAWKRFPTVAVYFVVYTVIVFAVAANAGTENTSFETEKLNICVIDSDDSGASRELVNFISDIHTVKDIKTDDESIRDALYYQTVDYVLTIKNGFEKNLENGETDGLFENVRRTDTYSSYLFDSQLTQYVSAVTMYMASGKTAEEACKSAGKAFDSGVDVTVENFDTGGGNVSEEAEDLGYFTQYLGYVFICILISGISPILMRLNEKDIRRRTDCSSLPVSRKTLQIFAGTAVAVLIVWAAFALLEVVKYGNSVFTKTGLLCLLNSFVYILVAAGITLVVAQFNLKDEIVSMISNVVSLGMAFLCGVFVPQYLLGDGVLAAAKFLPAYWFVRANNMLCGFSEEVFSMDKYMEYLGVELVFAAVLFIIVMIISKCKMRSAE